MADVENDSTNQGGWGRQLPTAVIAVGLTVAGVVGSGIGGYTVALIVGALTAGDPTELFWFTAALTFGGELGFFAVGYGYARVRDRDIPLTGLTDTDTRDALLGTVGALVVGVGLFQLLAVVDLQPESAIAVQNVDPATFFLTAAVFVLAAPPAEEYLFRGVIQGRLRETFGSTGAMAGAGLLFGMIHFFNYVGSPLPAMVAGALILSLVGAIFGYAYERTDNLFVPIVAHVGYNFALMAVSAIQFH